MSRRVYLDNAATTWPKSKSVLDACQDFLENCGATAGRGSYASARVAEDWLERGRRSLSKLVDGNGPDSIAFCSSGTHALNAVIGGLLSDGEHVLTTQIEHNSVLRPLAQLQHRKQIQFDVIPASDSHRIEPEAASSLVQSNTRMLIVGHASNVTGRANDLEKWGAFAAQHKLLFVVDGSQTLGYLPVSIKRANISAFASAGHKGLGGLAGTGFVHLSPDLHSVLEAQQFGGTGSSSESIDSIPEWPQSIEVGNLNLPGIVSMAVAAEELLEFESLHEGWLPSFSQLVRQLRDIPAVQIVVHPPIEASLPDFVPVVSFQVEGWDVHDLAAILGDEFGVEVRAGLHCAALVHQHLNPSSELENSSARGTLRLSSGRSTTLEDVTAAVEALRTILA